MFCGKFVLFAFLTYLCIEIIDQGFFDQKWNSNLKRNRTMKKSVNGCLILIIAIVLLAFVYLIWTFTVMS